MVTWQVKNVISLLLQGLWIPNLAGWWISMRRPYPQSHVTHQPRGQVTNQKRYISTFTRSMAPKLARTLSQDEESQGRIQRFWKKGALVGHHGWPNNVRNYRFLAKYFFQYLQVFSIFIYNESLSMKSY